MSISVNLYLVKDNCIHVCREFQNQINASSSSATLLGQDVRFFHFCVPLLVTVMEFIEFPKVIRDYKQTKQLENMTLSWLQLFINSPSIIPINGIQIGQPIYTRFYKQIEKNILYNNYLSLFYKNVYKIAIQSHLVTDDSETQQSNALQDLNQLNQQAFATPTTETHQTSVHSSESSWIKV